jgi:peptide/nickel transport system permease protein
VTTAPVNPETVEYEPRVGRSLWGDAAVRLLRSPTSLVCMFVIVVYAFVAIGAGYAFPDWSKNPNYTRTNEAPSGEYWLGTDEFGRSVLQKTLLGAKVSMTVGFMANIIAIPLGILLGAVAGYYGGWVDDIIVWLFTTLAAIPGLIRVIAIKFAFQDTVLWEGTRCEVDLGGMSGIILALAITGWIGTCRLVRAETMKIRELDYVLAARASGRGGFAILLRHVVPNVTHVGIINFSLGFVGAVKAEVILSYLGLGVGAGGTSWGRMIDAARWDLIVGRWWQLTAAGVAMFLLVLALNLLGDRLRDALDPRLRNV